MSLKNKLQRMKGHLSLEGGSCEGHYRESLTDPVAPASSGASIDVPFAAEWESMGTRPIIQGDDYFLLREQRYPLSHRHGLYELGELLHVVGTWGEASSTHPLSTKGGSAQELLFFDTETTGLQGGVGNTIFLLGYAFIQGEELIVRQHLLPGPHAEGMFYDSFVDHLEGVRTLITFNGKSFDWPQVKTRHTLHRHEIRPLPDLYHIDLLHGSRRLWKQELESCRLGHIEQHKLGIHREEDVPGYLAPTLYFQFIQRQDPATLAGVLKHNEWDVLSLVTLYIHLSKCLLEEQQLELEPIELYEIARWHEAMGEWKEAQAIYEHLLGYDRPWSMKARVALGYLFKRQKIWRKALSHWEAAIAQGSDNEEVLVEVAKIYEHDAKDFTTALSYARQAYEIWKTRRPLRSRMTGRGGVYNAKDYLKRIDRLSNRIDRLDEFSRPTELNLFSGS